MFTRYFHLILYRSSYKYSLLFRVYLVPKYFNRFHVKNVFDRFLNRNKRFSPVIFSFSLINLLTSLGLMEEKKEQPELLITMKRGELLYQQNRYDDAERMYHVALRLAQQLQHEGAVIFIYDRLANIALDSGHYEKSIKLFKVVIRDLLSKEVPLNDPSIINISLKIGISYQNLKNTKEAISCFEFCVNNLEPALENAVKEKDKNIINLWIQLTHVYSNYHYELGNGEMAVKYAKLAYEMAAKDGLDEDRVMLLADLAKMYLHVGDLKNAQECAENGLSLAKTYTYMPYISNFYILLAGVAIQGNMLNDAMSFCRNAMRRANFYQYENGVAAAKHCINYVNEELERKT